MVAGYEKSDLFFNCVSLDQSQPQEAAATKAIISKQKQRNKPTTTRNQQSSVNQIKNSSRYF